MNNENVKTIRLEICDSTRWVLLAAILGAVALGLAAMLGNSYTHRAEAAFAAGYEAGTVPGANGVYWVKVRK